jgi:hypothetical protein
MLLWLAGCFQTTNISAAPPGAIGHDVAIDVACASSGVPQSDTSWVCPASLTLDCSALANPAVVTVQSPRGQTCNSAGLDATLTGPLSVGPNTLAVRDQRGQIVCSTQLTVLDHGPPILIPHVVNLWPPNHKFHDISVEDCVTIQDSCDDSLQAEFIWASSDEPIDDIGDGHFAPDIALSSDCRRVSVRSERQGPENGRVYKLGVRVVDRGGNASEAVCQVIVDHDQRGVLGADSGEAYRVTFNGARGGPRCDGVQPPAPPRIPPPSSPPPPPPQQPPPSKPPAVPLPDAPS